MAQMYLGEIKLMAFSFAPKGWALCNGQLLAIQSNAALFALLGTTYGGNGIQTFALPDLRGRAGVSAGAPPGGSPYTLGEIGGVENVTLLSTQIPLHFHGFNGATPNAKVVERNPSGGLLAFDSAKTTGTPADYYAADSNALQPLAPVSLNPAGSNLPHANLQPYLVMNFCIALTGIFPSRT